MKVLPRVTETQKYSILLPVVWEEWEQGEEIIFSEVTCYGDDEAATCTIYSEPCEIRQKVKKILLSPQSRCYYMVL